MSEHSYGIYLEHGAADDDDEPCVCDTDFTCFAWDHDEEED
jgi:hypothetical protein